MNLWHPHPKSITIMNLLRLGHISSDQSSCPWRTADSNGYVVWVEWSFRDTHPGGDLESIRKYKIELQDHQRTSSGINIRLVRVQKYSILLLFLLPHSWHLQDVPFHGHVELWQVDTYVDDITSRFLVHVPQINLLAFFAGCEAMKSETGMLLETKQKARVSKADKHLAVAAALHYSTELLVEKHNNTHTETQTDMDVMEKSHNRYSSIYRQTIHLGNVKWSAVKTKNRTHISWTDRYKLSI